MQKYFNIIYGIVLVLLVLFVIRIQLFGQVDEVKKSLDAQSKTMDGLQADIAAIVTGINEQLQASQQQSGEQQQLEVPSAEDTEQ